MELAMIWDLDGTLLDSYDVIVTSLLLAGKEFGVSEQPENILEVVKRETVGAYEKLLAERARVPIERVRSAYQAHQARKEGEIPLMDGAREALGALTALGCEHYIFTHSGKSYLRVLDRLGVGNYFKEVVTGDRGFPPKPAPDAVLYLLEKYGIPKDNAFYVGDRDIDGQCAANAGVRSILLKSPYCKYRANYEVDDLRDIRKIFEEN